LRNWSITWQLQIATDKCFVCTVSNVHHKIECSSRAYGICNKTFANVDCVRAIGVMVDSRLKCDKDIAEIVHKAMSRANLILKSFHSHDRTLLTTAFCTYVRIQSIVLQHGLLTHSVLSIKLKMFSDILQRELLAYGV